MRVVVVAAALAIAMPARADDADALAEAARLEERLDYQGALDLIEAAIAKGTAGRDELVTLHMHAGKLAAGLDRKDVAESHYAIVLALAPTTTLPAGTSPKIVEPFEAARRRGAPLRVSAHVEASAVAITADADPLVLVRGIAVRAGDREVRDAHALRVALPSGTRATEVSALDAYGNRVWTQPIVDEPRMVTVDRPLYARWPIWAATTAAVLGAGGLCAWRMQTAIDEHNHELARGAEYTRLQALANRASSWATGANISWSAAAASGLVAIILAARGSQRTVIVTAQHDGAGIGVVGAF